MPARTRSIVELVSENYFREILDRLKKPVLRKVSDHRSF